MLTLQPYIEEIFNHLRAEPFKKFLERYVVDEKKDPMSPPSSSLSFFIWNIAKKYRFIFFSARSTRDFVNGKT